MLNHRLTPVYAALLADILSGCLGSGSSPALRRIMDPTIPPPASATNPDRITVSGGTAVTVAVVDTGARVTHNEFSSGQVVGTYNVLDGSSNVTDNDAVNHGTAMSSIVAGKTQGYSGNAKLLIVKSLESSLVNDITQANGVAYAAQNGARVINTSTGGYQTTHPDAVAPYQAIVTRDAVWVTSAGNGGMSIADARMASAFFMDSRPDLADIRNRMLVVGRLNLAENARDTDSDYPGSNPLLQQRFVLAPGTKIGAAVGTNDTGYREVDGTSPAAAVASALAASIISKWPHLTAPQTSSLILDTAKRTDSLYSQNNCGASGTMNCGAFYMGRGIMDPVAAMNPVGTLAMANTDAVDGPRTSVAKTGLLASAAFGDAFNGLNSMPVAAFDDYGRDYQVMLRMVAARTALQRFGGLGAFMQRGSSARYQATDALGQSQESWLRFDADGSPVAAALSFQAGETRVTGYRFGYGESNPAAMPEGLAPLRLLSYNGNSTIANDYLAVSGVSGEFGAGVENVRIGFDAWRANNTVSGLDGGRESATRTEVAVRYAPTDWMRLSAGVAGLAERNALLGTKASGSLAVGAGAPLVTYTLGLDLAPMPGTTVFARYEAGRMGAMTGNGVIERVSGVEVSQFAAGASFATDDFRAALVASSPLRVETAAASLNVPTGRTIDGKVLRSHYTANLAPSGQERSIEFALAAAAGKVGQVSLNLSRTFEPGHDASAAPENMVTVGYQTAF